MRVVLDTNVLISATFWIGDSFRIMKLIESGRIRLVLSRQIVEEYYEILMREEIKAKVEDKKLKVQEVVEKQMELAEIVEPKTHFDIITRDPDDNKFLDCAVEAKADFIIS